MCVTNKFERNDNLFLNACACRPCEDPLSVVNKCIESLEKLVNLKTSADRALYVGSIEKLQLAVCTEGETPAFLLVDYFHLISFFIATECRRGRLLQLF